MKTSTGSLPLGLLLLSATVSNALKFPVRQVISATDAHLQKRGGNMAYGRPVVAAADDPNDISMS